MPEYIEREILLNTLDEVCRVACPYSERRDIAQYVKCGACPLGSAFDFVDDIPAADVRPVVHGKWLDRSSGWTFNSECNKCGFIVHEQFIKTYKYCPNCGADMRGKKDV